MNRLWILHRYLGGVVAIAAILFSALLPGKIGLLGLPLWVLSGAIVGSYTQRKLSRNLTIRQSLTPSQQLMDKTGWLIVHSVGWSVLICLELFHLFMLGIGQVGSQYPLIVRAGIGNVMIGLIVGLVISVIQASMWRSHIKSFPYWIAFRLLSWPATAILFSLGLLLVAVVSGVPLMRPIAILSCAPLVWMTQAIFTDWALRMASRIGETRSR